MSFKRILLYMDICPVRKERKLWGQVPTKPYIKEKEEEEEE